jgi:alpha-tubulin suppressor-like RCC1 family protein
MKSLLLIDNRINDISTVTQSLNIDTTYIIIDYDNDTYDSIISKISKISENENVLSYNNVGVFQENYDLDCYQFINSFEKSLLENVEELDNNLYSWSQFKLLISYFKNVLMASNIDLMGCNIHSNINWNFVIEKIQNEIKININSSNDNTGNAQLDGNWILESNNKDLIGSYFTENIKTYNFILGYTNNHSVFLMKNGYIYSCGSNNFGQLCNGSIAPAYYPVQVKKDNNNFLENIVQVSAGESHTAYLSNTGAVYTGGYNAYRQLGDGTTSTRYYPVQVKKDNNSFLENIVQVSAGRVHTLFLINDGSVYATGNSSLGQLGYGSTSTPSFPVKVKINANTELSSIIQVSAGYSHSLFLTKNGTVYACGYNLRGELGNGTTTQSNFSILINNPSLTNIVQVSGGFYHSLFVKSNGTVLSCGRNDSGQLGDNTNIQKLSPVSVINLTDIIQVSAGYLHSIFLKSDGTAYTCGYNNYKQLADGTSVTRRAPVSVVKEPNTTLTNITQINTGSYVSLFLTNTHDVYAIGKYTDGQLGNGTISYLYDYVNFVKNNDTVLILFDIKLNYVYSINDYNQKYYLLKNTTGVSNTNVNYTVNDLLISGLSVSSLKSAPYNFTDSDILNSTNVPIFNRSWFQNNYTIQQIISVYSAYQLYNSGYSILEIYNSYINNNYASEKMFYYSGFKLSFLLDNIPNYTLTRLLEQQQNGFILTLLGITNPPINNFIYNVPDLLTTNDKLDRKLIIPDFVNGGVTINYLYERNVTISDLLNHYNVLNLLNTSENTTKLTVQNFLNSNYSVQFLIENEVTIKYLYENGVTINTLLNTQNILNIPNNYTVLDLLTSNSEENDTKLTIQDFFDSGFTIEYLVNNYVKFRYLYENGITINTLLNIYNSTEIITINNGDDGKFTISELISNGVTFKKLVTDGVTVYPDLLNPPNNYTVQDLLTSNNGEDGKLTIPELLLYGATFQILLSGGISISNLRTYYTLNNLITSNNGLDGKLTVRQLLTTNLGIDGKFTVQNFLNNDPSFSLTYLHNKGISFLELTQNGITITILKNEFQLIQLITLNNRIDGGLTYRDLFNGGVTFTKFLEAGITIDNLLYPNNSQDNGFTIQELVNNGITYQVLFNGGISISTLLNYYTVLELLTANNGLIIQNFINSNYSIRFLVNNGVKFKYLLENNSEITVIKLLEIFTINELITTNNGIDGKFTIQELIQDYNVNINLFINNNIITILELLSPPYNFSIQYLLNNGITLKKMNDNGVTISTLLNNNFSLKQLLDGGISIITLLANNISIQQLLDNNISLKQMYNYGLPISVLLNYYYSIQQLLSQGITINDFLNDGYYELLQQSNIDIFTYDSSVTVASLLQINFTKEYIYNLNRYTIFQLIEGGFTQSDLRPRGIYYLNPTNSYELRVSLNSDYTDIYINQDLILVFNNLINGSNKNKFIKDGSNKSVKILYSK